MTGSLTHRRGQASAISVLGILLLGALAIPAPASEPAMSRPATSSATSIANVADSGYRSPVGPFEVAVTQPITLHDTFRNKNLSLRVHYPKADQAFPVLIFSHGLLGNNDDPWPLIDWWVSHGYVVVRPEHADARRLLGHEPTEQEADSLLQKLFGEAQSWQDRGRDIAFIMDSLGEVLGQAPELRGRIDEKHIGVVGHSYGAHTAGLLGGATITVPGLDHRVSMADPRVAAIILIAGQGIGVMGLDSDSWKNLTRPMMVIGGSKDSGPAGHEPKWRMDPFTLAPSGDHYSVFIQGAEHMSYLGRTSSDVGEKGRVRNEITAAMCAATLAFWDAYLKGDGGAKAFIEQDKLGETTAGRANLQRK